MAYTFTTVDSAFSLTYDEEGNPLNNGYDYQNANELLKRIADTGEGRLFMNSEGSIVYENRYHRDA